jgi:hypothetical protein
MGADSIFGSCADFGFIGSLVGLFFKLTLRVVSILFVFLHFLAYSLKKKLARAEE